MKSQKTGDNLSPVELLHTRTLITGEINTGKTTLTARLADSLCQNFSLRRIAVLDMAPSVPKAVRNKVSGFIDFKGMRKGVVFRGGLAAPRLMGRSQSHSIELAEKNKKRIDKWLKQTCASGPYELLILNDMSLYLQAGKFSGLLPVLNMSRTVLANSYLGQALGQGQLSEREHQSMQELELYFELRLHLSRVYP